MILFRHFYYLISRMNGSPKEPLHFKNSIIFPLQACVRERKMKLVLNLYIISYKMTKSASIAIASMRTIDNKSITRHITAFRF